MQYWDPGMKDLAGNWTGGQDLLRVFHTEKQVENNVICIMLCLMT